MAPPFCWRGAEGDSPSENNMAMRTPITTKGPLMISSPVGQSFPSMPTISAGTAAPSAVVDAAWAMKGFASDYLLPLLGDGKSQAAPLFILGVQLSGLLGRISSDLEAIRGSIVSEHTNRQSRTKSLRLFLSKCLILKVSFVLFSSMSLLVPLQHSLT